MPIHSLNGHARSSSSSLPGKNKARAGAAGGANPTHPTGQQPNRSQRVGKRVGRKTTRTKKTSKKSGKRGAKRVGSNVLGKGAKAANPLGVGAVAAFPVEVFPDALQKHFTSIAAALPCPVDFIVTLALAVFGTCIGRSRCLEIKPGWKEYPLLWAIIVGRSGDRKSPAFAEVTTPLRRQQEKFLAEYRKAKERYNALPVDQRKDEPYPELKQIFTTDTTMEALKDVQKVNPRGVALSADEVSGHVKSMGQYKGGGGDDRQAWLSIWSGTPIVSNRRGNPEPIVIPNPFVSILGGIQPDVLPVLIDDSREDGFSARLLVSYPDPIPQPDWTDDVVQQGDTYLDICDELLRLKTQKEPITVSPEAKEKWVEWVNGHRAEQPADNLRATWSKAEGHCLRLTLILHLVRMQCRETKSKQIDRPSMEGGIALIEYFKSHAQRVYQKAAMASDNDRVSRALRWIKKRGGKVTARLAHMNGVCKSSEEAKELLEFLAQEKHGITIKGKQENLTFILQENQ